MQDSIFDLIKEVMAPSDLHSDSAVGAWQRLKNGWSGYSTRYEGLPPFPDVKLTFVEPYSYEVSNDEIRNTLPLFEVEVEVLGKRPGEEGKIIRFSGFGTTFSAAIGHLLERIHAASLVWQGTLDVVDQTSAQLWAYLTEHPFFGESTSECIRIHEKLDTSYLWPQPVYVLDAGPYRPDMGYDSFLHVSAPTMSATLTLLVERIKRIYDGQTVLISSDRLKWADALMKEYDLYSKVAFCFTKTGVQATLRDWPEGTEYEAEIRQMLCQPVEKHSYEEVIVYLAETVAEFRGVKHE